MNRVIMIGRLTKDPEVRYAQVGEDQRAVARFSIAVDRKIKKEGNPNADFFNCSAFGKTAEFVEKYLKKGTKIALEGSIQNNTYTGRDGVKRYDTQIVIEQLEFAESKGSGTTSDAPAVTTDADGFMNVPDGLDEELPFA